MIPDERYGDPLLTPALEIIQDLEFRQAVTALGGYDTSHTGENISF